MKKYLSILSAGLLLCSLASCDKDTEGLTEITYYPVIELDGPTLQYVATGSPYVDPGYSATMEGKDITADVKVSSNMDYADPQPGVYYISYSAVNSDGLSRAASRTVIVFDPEDSYTGIYTVNDDSFREYNGGEVYYGGYPINVIGNGDGTYAVDDLMGGWYMYRAGYGSNYAMEGEIEIADGVISLVSSYVPGWGDAAEGLTDGVADADAGTLSWVVEYTDYPFYFHVNLVDRVAFEKN